MVCEALNSMKSGERRERKREEGGEVEEFKADLTLMGERLLKEQIRSGVMRSGGITDLNGSRIEQRSSWGDIRFSFLNS
jgi:hypothetical protein